eukprot:UN02239
MKCVLQGLTPEDILSSSNVPENLKPPRVEPLSPEEIHRDYTSPTPVPYSGLASVEFGESGLTLVADQHNPRHFVGFIGKDMAEIGEHVSDKHLDYVLQTLESIRKIPEGSLLDLDPEKDRRQRRSQ